MQEGRRWTNETDFASTKYAPADIELLGSSLLHPLPKWRDCDSMHIPFQFCSCSHAFTFVKNAEAARVIGALVVERMNEALANSTYRKLCVRLQLDDASTEREPLKEFESDDPTIRIFNAHIRVKPSGGHYDAYAEVSARTVSQLASQPTGRLAAYCKFLSL